MSKTKIWLKDVNFDFEPTEDNPLGPHLAYTTPSQGGAASGLNDPLVLKASTTDSAKESLELVKKAKEVGVLLSMEEFLMRFFGMWEADAAGLAKLLGYSSEIFENALKEEEQWGDSYYADKVRDMQSKVTLMKSLVTGEQKYEELDVLKQIELLDVQEAVEKNLSQMTVSMRLDDFLAYFKEEVSEEEQEEAFYHWEQREGGMVPVVNENFFEQRVSDMDFLKSLSLDKISELTEEQKLKAKLFQSDFEKGLLSGNSPEGRVEGSDEPHKSKDPIEKGEDSNMSEKETTVEGQVDVNKAFEESSVYKAMQEELAELRKAREAAAHKELVEKTAGFSFCEAEDAEALAGVLKALESENQDALLAVLVKANEALKDAKENGEMFTQKSVSGEAEDYAPESTLSNKVSKALQG